MHTTLLHTQYFPWKYLSWTYFNTCFVSTCNSHDVYLLIWIIQSFTTDFLHTVTLKCAVTTGEEKHGWWTFLHALFVVFLHFNLHISLHQICPNFQIIACYTRDTHINTIRTLWSHAHVHNLIQTPRNHTKKESIRN